MFDAESVLCPNRCPSPAQPRWTETEMMMNTGRPSSIAARHAGDRKLSQKSKQLRMHLFLDEWQQCSLDFTHIGSPCLSSSSPVFNLRNIIPHNGDPVTSPEATKAQQLSPAIRPEDQHNGGGALCATGYRPVQECRGWSAVGTGHQPSSGYEQGGVADAGEQAQRRSTLLCFPATNPISLIHLIF